MPQKQKITAEEKVSLVRRYKAGEISLAGASLEGQADEETMRGWVRQYEAEGISAFLPGRRNRVYK